MILNATRVPRLYLLRQRLRCTRLDPVRTGGVYRLVAGRLGVEAISAGGAAGSIVVVRQVARAESDERPCRAPRGPAAHRAASAVFAERGCKNARPCDGRFPCWRCSRS
jgi:hypothetical protein